MESLSSTNQDTACDVILIAEGHEFAVHRHILSKSCSYFKEKLQSETSSAQSIARIELKEIKSDILSEIINYVYTQEINITQENVQPLYAATDYMEYYSLRKLCLLVICKNFEIKNCLDILKFSKLYNDLDLSDCTMAFIGINFSKLIEDETFLGLNYDELVYIFNINEVAYNNEKFLFQGTLNWINKDKEEREKYFMELIKYIKFSNLPIEYLKSIDINDPTLKTIEFYTLIIDTYKYKYRVKTQIFGIDNLAIYVFNLTNKMWREISRLPLVIENYSVVILNNTLYILGGALNGNPLNTVMRYDAGKTKLDFVCPMLNRRSKLEANVLNGKIYAVGGLAEDENLQKSAERYDPKTNQWKMIPDMLYEDVYKTVVSDRFLFVFGELQENKTRNVQVFDPIKNYWFEEIDLINFREGEDYLISNNTLYAYLCRRINLCSLKLLISPQYSDMFEYDNISQSIPREIEDIDHSQLINVRHQALHFRFIHNSKQLIILKMPVQAGLLDLDFLLTMKME